MSEPRVEWSVKECVDWIIDNDVIYDIGYTINTIDDVRVIIGDVGDVFEVYLEYNESEIKEIFELLKVV